MSMNEITVGQTRWSLAVPEERLIRARSRGDSSPPIGDVAAAVREALDHPLRIDFPLHRALTPDDRIALVIDERLPRLGELVGGMLQYIAAAGIGPESVTIITSPSARSSDWINDLPDEFADVHTEVHHPGDRKLLSYLATTRRGRRVYMNRTLIDSDQAIVVTGRGYDVQTGYSGCEVGIFPSLSDTESQQAIAVPFSMSAPSGTGNAIRVEALEIAGLLSSTIFVQVIEGADDTIAHICAGLLATSADGIRLQDDRWRFTIDRPADIAIASISGDPRRHDFEALARAASAASRAVRAGGCIVVLSEAESAVSESMELLRQAEEPEHALRLLREAKPPDAGAAFQWASAADHARLYLVSGMKPEIVEEMFATPICSVEEVQRLIDKSGSCLIVPDAHKSLVVVE